MKSKNLIGFPTPFPFGEVPPPGAGECKLLNTIKNKEGGRKLSQNGKYYIKKFFNWEKITNEYINMYNKIL